MFQRVSVSTRGPPAIYDAVADGVDTVKLSCGTCLPATYRYPCFAHVHKRAASQTDARAHQRRNYRQAQNVVVLVLESRLSMAMRTVAQAGVNAPCHCYTRLRALTASPLFLATAPRLLLQVYCKSCMLSPTQPVLPFAAAHEMFQAGSRQQPTLTRPPNRRVEHHMNTVSHRDMVAFFSQ